MLQSSVKKKKKKKKKKKAKSEKSVDEMVKAIENNQEYKVLSKAEYEALLTLAAKKDVVSSEENAGAKRKNVDQKAGTPKKSSTHTRRWG